MAWFRYLDSDGKYLYPNLRKKIVFPIDPDSEKHLIQEDVLKNSWLFINVKNLKIDIKNSLTLTDGSFVVADEVNNNSYLVVYESKSSNNHNSTPVMTQIVGDLLYFKAAEDHPKNININNEYSLYYKTPDLKLIKKVVGTNEYQQCAENQSEFISASVNNYFHVRSLDSSSYYSLSFINSELYWDSGVSKKPGASLIGTFTGPNLKVYCDKGPDYGRFAIKITVYGSELDVDNEVVLDWESIDLYSEDKSENVQVFFKTDLLYKNYVFEIFSENKNINIKEYSFSLNNFLTLQREEINPNLLVRE